MTEYFEVHERDGAARVGEVRLPDPTTTPALAGDLPVADAGSLWTADREVPEGEASALTILPHRGFPSGTDPEVQDAFAVEYPDVDYPSAAVVSPRTAADHGADAYVLSGAQGIVGHASAFREAIVETRESIPADTALYLPGVATPANAALLAYAGVDLVDTDAAVVKGTQGRYLTTDGDRELADLEELPCVCPACRGGIDAFDREACTAHNEYVLRAELARIRRRIREGTLRDYLEAQARTEPWLTAALREFDQQWGYVEERAPIQRGATMAATTEDALHRPEIQRFADRVCTRYRNRFEDVPLLLVPCSARKPYSDSQSHGQFQEAARYRAHVVSMTSPIGVVPRELEYTYPAQHYDAAVTGRWSATEVEFVAEVLQRYLDGKDYPRVVAHVPPGGYREVCERVADEASVPFEYTVEDHPTTDESLANLAAALEGERTVRVAERERKTLRAVADWQFGAGAGADPAFLGRFELRGREPKLSAFARESEGEGEDEQLAALVPRYGTLSLTLAGARRWVESDVPTKRVEIDGFVPRGSVLAPGILDADADIRVGDEVVVEGPAAFAVGRAEMTGPEMAGSTRGVACKPRHVAEK